MNETNRAWFRRGKGGLGHVPQTWQGWVSLGLFIAVLLASVAIIERLMVETERGQGIVFVIAAVEIMIFLKFVRRRSAPPAAKIPGH